MYLFLALYHFLEMHKHFLIGMKDPPFPAGNVQTGSFDGVIVHRLHICFRLVHECRLHLVRKISITDASPRPGGLIPATAGAQNQWTRSTSSCWTLRTRVPRALLGPGNNISKDGETSFGGRTLKNIGRGRERAHANRDFTGTEVWTPLTEAPVGKETVHLLLKKLV